MKTCLMFLAFACSLAAADAESEIRATIAKYAKSVDDADVALAARVWSQDAGVTFIHPLGHERGFAHIRDHVYVGLMGGMFSARRLSIHDLSVHVSGNSGWAEFYWDFQATLRKEGTPVNTAGRETQIYRREAGGWRIVHVHYSAMPPVAP